MYSILNYRSFFWNCWENWRNSLTLQNNVQLGQAWTHYLFKRSLKRANAEFFSKEELSCSRMRQYLRRYFQICPISKEWNDNTIKMKCDIIKFLFRSGANRKWKLFCLIFLNKVNSQSSLDVFVTLSYIESTGQS